MTKQMGSSCCRPDNTNAGSSACKQWQTCLIEQQGPVALGVDMADLGGPPAAVIRPVQLQPLVLQLWLHIPHAQQHLAGRRLLPCSICIPTTPQFPQCGQLVLLRRADATGQWTSTCLSRLGRLCGLSGLGRCVVRSVGCGCVSALDLCCTCRQQV